MGVGGTGTDYIPGWANVPSSVNTFTTGATAHTGSFENLPYPWALIRTYSSNQSGTLTIVVRNPNVATDITTFTRTITAGTSDFFPFLKGDAEVKVSWSSGVAPSVLSVHTSYGMYAQGVSSIGRTIGSQDVASTVKAVISGVGNTNAKVTDHAALQVTFPPEGKSSFGELSTVYPFSIVQLQFPYNINTSILNVYENTSGAVTHASRLCNVSSGASANSYARVTTRRAVKYNPGQGVMVRFAAKFGTGTANNTQLVGIGTESDGFFFGYNGTSFGILHRHNGSPEIRTLQITTKSTTAENITVTLDGDAIATIAVTNAAATNATTTANEIAAGNYLSVGNGWVARAKGDTVEFISLDAASHSGTFSITATTAVGTFTQRVAGAAPTEEWVAQSSWNGDDVFDGSGITGVTLNPQKINVYQIKFQYLGGGLITFYLEDPDDGELHLVHGIAYANAYTVPSLGDASMPLYIESNNSSNTSAVSIAVSSMAGFIEGEPQKIGARYGARSVKTDVTTALRPLITVRQGQYLNSLAVKSFSAIMRLSVSAEHTKPINIVIIRNGTLTSASFSRIESNSAVEIDTSASSITGGTELDAIPLGKTGQQQVSYMDDYFANNIYPGEWITVCAITVSGVSGEATVGLKILERI